MRATIVRRFPIRCDFLTTAGAVIFLLGISAIVQPMVAEPPNVRGIKGAPREDAHWIWSPEHEKASVPAGACYFRKTFMLGRPEEGHLQVVADDRYTIYINGRTLGSGTGADQFRSYDISRYLTRGRNVIAVRVKNSEKGDAGLAIRAVARDSGGTHVSHATDKTWKTSIIETPHWMKPTLDDSSWQAAQSFGQYGATTPGSTATQRNAEPFAAPPLPVTETKQTRTREPNGDRVARNPVRGDRPEPTARTRRPDRPRTVSDLLKGKTPSDRETRRIDATSDDDQLVQNPPAQTPTPAQKPTQTQKQTPAQTPTLAKSPSGKPSPRVADADSSPTKRDAKEMAAERIATESTRDADLVITTGAETPSKDATTDDEESLVTGPAGRFNAPAEFEVEWVIAPKLTGSLIAMTFNEFGQIIASQEGGPLLLLTDKDQDGIHDSVATYCDRLKNCQGMLAINGALLAIGDGPEGVALYRLGDDDRDGSVDRVETIIKFKGKMGEHGPHAVRLGPDGLIYVVVGNHAAIDEPIDPASPHRDYYEGDLVQPRYEDPRGHAAGLKTPAGTVIRTDMSGSFVQVVTGGLRNPYDFAFNRQGDMFTCDADMEWDLGTPWYRPTRVNHLTEGAEFGWRSGWAKWPEYYIDSLPATADMGPGSPTGVAIYDHYMYPVRYHGAMFVGDWALGRINVVNFERSGATYTARARTFVEGRPLNITDVEVGPDGWLYFCTGGRGTAGGIYRVVWTRNVPAEMAALGTGVTRAIRQPQFTSAWARQRIAAVKREAGGQWESALERIATNTRFAVRHRVRALDVMQLFGPSPSPTLLTRLASDAKPEIRAKAVYLMGLHDDDETRRTILRLLEDSDAMVRRQACESLTRRSQPPSAERLVPLLADSDRFVAYAARRAIERCPLGEWQEDVLTSNQTRVFLQGATAMLVAHPGDETARMVIARMKDFIRGKVNDPEYPAGFISDKNFTDLVRVIQLAMLRSNLTAGDVTDLQKMLAAEYPSTDPIINRELIRVLAYFEDTSITKRVIAQLRSDLPSSEKLHLAMHAPHFAEGWSTENRMQWLTFYEQVRANESGLSVPGYIDQVSRDFFEHLTDSERRLVLSDGAKWPNSALAVLARMPQELDIATLGQLIRLDKKLTGKEGKAFDRLRVGTVAILARSGKPRAFSYLRELYERAPERRPTVAMGLAQHPDGENWPVLVTAVPVLESTVAREVLDRLHTIDRKPDGPEPLRQVILAGLRSKETVGPAAINLLDHWTGEQQGSDGDSPAATLAAWQSWFADTYPDQPQPQLPVDSPDSRWTYDELLRFLNSDDGRKGDPARGAIAFGRGECAKCHRFGSAGERIGPDLTSVGQRFHQKEILESILFPSHVISDQYASQKILTTEGRVYVGIVAPAGGDSVFVLQQDGEKVEIAKSDIEEQVPSRESSMPSGLLDKLTLQEIADLFAYLRNQPRTATTNRRGARNR